MDEQQIHVVRLDAFLARRVQLFLDAGSGYHDLSELVSVALGNQLAMEQASPVTGIARTVGRRETTGPDLAAQGQRAEAPVWDVLRLPSAEPEVVDPDDTWEAQPLLSLTNRLFPIKVAARVLANLPPAPTLAVFQRSAASAARELGLALRDQDLRMGRKGVDRRWIALPVGRDEPAALNRYIHHFTLKPDSDDRTTGPLAELGLAGLDDAGRPRLTRLGAQLALESNPILDDGEGDATLSPLERETLVDAIRGNRAEFEAVRQFISVVRDHHGQQSDIDATIAVHHAGWSDAQAVSHRAAMVGRLHDLEMVAVEGRGPGACIRVVPEIDSYWGCE